MKNEKLEDGEYKFKDKYIKIEYGISKWRRWKESNGYNMRIFFIIWYFKYL